MLVVGANLCLDRTLRMDRLVPGTVQRPRSADLVAGGKAVNVCRAAAAHGVRTRLVGNLPGVLGRYVGDLLHQEGIDVRRVVTAGEIRSATIILEDDLRATVLNEPGPQLAEPDRSAFLFAVGEELPGHDVVVMSGSLPPGPHQDLYADLVELSRARGVRSVVDTSREALLAVLPHHPDVVTPNLHEARAVLAVLRGETDVPALDEPVEPGSGGSAAGGGAGGVAGGGGGEGGLVGAADLSADTRAEIRAETLAAARALHAAGAGAALVTAGRHGVALVRDSGELWFAAPPVAELNPIGAGDAFAAGLGAGLELGDPLERAVLRAVASGSSSVSTPVAGQVDVDLLRDLLAGLPSRSY